MLKKIFLLVGLMSVRQGLAQVSEIVQRDTFSVYFNVDTYSLSNAAEKTLDSIFSDFQGKEKIALYGYADQRGENEENFSLSTKRALKIKAFLISKGVPDSNLHTEGKGILISDTSSIALSKSRRVDIIIRRLSPCYSVENIRQFTPFYFHFNRGKLVDSSLTEWNNLVSYLKSNPCLKAKIYTYKICDICKNEENLKLATEQTIESTQINAIRAYQLLQSLKSKGIDVSQFSERSMNIGCKKNTAKSVQSLDNKEESILILQRRVDIILHKK
ncbi:MAG: OmpA family protein [Chitinophagaceae bacterium]|jgi:hypothetical protein